MADRYRNHVERVFRAVLGTPGATDELVRRAVESRAGGAHTRAMTQATFARVTQLDEFRWMLPREGGMRVPGVLIADKPLLEKMLSDRTPDQVRNAAHLPGILEASIAMPDAHWGYGLPVGGVVATEPGEGVVSPGAVGYDIGCGVRLMKSRLTRADLPLNLPAGWEFDKVFGDRPTGPSLQPAETRRADRADRPRTQLSAAAFRAVAQSALPQAAGAPAAKGVALPQTATDAELHMWLGLALFGTSLVLMMRGRRRGVAGG